MRIEGNIGVSLSTRLGAGNSGGAQAIGAGSRVLSRGVEDLSRTTTALQVTHMRRFNERKVHEAELAYRSFKTDLLYGDDGITRRQGADADGMTEEAATRLQEFMQDIDPQQPNHVVRQAVRQRLERDIAQTNDFVARHEQQKLEQFRVSQSGALYEQRRIAAVQQERERLMPGSDLFEEELAERLRLLSSANPQMAPEEVQIRAEKHIADDALKAVFSMMEEGPHRVPEAMQIERFYGQDWDPQQRAAFDKRVEAEVGFGMMQSTIATWSSEHPGHSRKELVEGATEQFERQYRAATGRPPRAEMIDAVQRRAASFDALVDDELKQRRDEEHASLLTGLVKATRGGNPVEVDAVFDAIEKEAFSNNDLTLFAAASELKANFDASRNTVFAPSMTPKGMELWLLPEGQVLPKAKLISAAAHMTEAKWQSWAPAHTAEAGGEAALKRTSRSELKAAINDNRALRGDSPYTASDKELGAKLAQLVILEQRFVEQNKGTLPSREQVGELVQAMEVSFDDDGIDGSLLGPTFTGTVGEFIGNPTGKKLDASQNRDRFILTNALAVARRDPQVARAVNEEFGHSFAFESATPEDIAGHPELVASLLELGVVSNVPITVDPTLGPLTGRRNIARGEALR